jgi:hypothetical protein
MRRTVQDEPSPRAAPAILATPGGWRIAAAIVLALAAAWAIWVHFAIDVVPFDDAYISIRYAENLAAGRGLIYNDGERVFGSTTPLFVLWLTALRLLGASHLDAAAVRANAIAFVAAALLAGWLVRRLTARPWIATVVAAAILVNPMLLVISSGAMETFWFLSLAFAALLALVADQPRPTLYGALAGLAILVRPEGILLGVVALLAWARRPRLLLSAAAGAAVPLAVWTLFATFYFGSPIPHSVIAKARPIYLLPRGFTIEQVIGNLDGWISSERLGALGGARRFAVAAILALAAAGSVLPAPARRRRAWLPLALLLGVVAIYGLANSLYFEWYWPFADVMLLLALVVGLAAIEGSIHQRLRDQGRPRWALLSRGGAAALFALWMVALATTPLRYAAIDVRMPMAFVKRTPTRQRTLAYLAAGESLARVAAPGDSVAAPEFGALGHVWRGRILDPLGLVSPEALPFLPIPPEEQAHLAAGAITIEFVQATRPDWIVAIPTYTSASLDPSAWFHQSYRVEGVMKLPFTIWGSDQLRIYRKRAVVGAEK